MAKMLGGSIEGRIQEEIERRGCVQNPPCTIRVPCPRSGGPMFDVPHTHNQAQLCDGSSRGIVMSFEGLLSKLLPSSRSPKNQNDPSKHPSNQEKL